MEPVTPKISLNGFRADLELKNVPVSFANALRRICLAEIPTVVVRDVQIMENNTKMVHEMLRHRVEMLPINVLPSESGVIRDTQIELKLSVGDEAKIVTSDDFVVRGPRGDVILKDRDLGEPLYFMKLGPNESVHLKASLGVDPRGSQVCVSTFKNHIDPEQVARDRDSWIMKGNDPRIYDNHHIQRSFSRDEHGRPNWFDFTVESIGVMPAKDLIKQSAILLKTKVNDWSKADIIHEDEPGYYRIESTSENHTVGRLAQEMIYRSGMADYVAYEVPHPLLPKMVLRFATKLAPDTVMEALRKELDGLCEILINI